MQRHRINFLDTDNQTDVSPQPREISHEKIHVEPPKQPKKKRSIFFIVLIILLLAGSLLTVKTLFGAGPDGIVYDPITLEAKKPRGLLTRIKQLVFGAEPVLAGHEEDRINILLMGMGGAGHDGPYLSDTIIIASIKPSTKEVAMITIPRDLGVNIPGYGWRKINHANAYGEAKNPGKGGEFAKQVISDTFGIPIHYYGRIDFKAFEEVIDAVGGVTVKVDQSFTDRQYPAPNDQYQVVSFQSGEQTMDGTTALKYARSRHGNNGEGSDFARSRRQLKIILALKEKVLSFGTLANPIRLKNIYSSIEKNVSTDMTFDEMLDMLQLGKDLDTANIRTLTLDNTSDGFLQNGFSASGAYILEPTSGNFDDITYAIEHIFDDESVLNRQQQTTVRAATQENTTHTVPVEIKENDTPTQTKPSFAQNSIEVLNGTWRVGLAARTEKLLEDNAFNITEIGNTVVRPIARSGIYMISTSTDSEVLNALKEALSIPIKQNLPTSTIPSESIDIVVILGEDYTE